jgi:hypothetical protein
MAWCSVKKAQGQFYLLPIYELLPNINLMMLPLRNFKAQRPIRKMSLYDDEKSLQCRKLRPKAAVLIVCIPLWGNAKCLKVSHQYAE